jgi:hypothetical protein
MSVTGNCRRCNAVGIVGFATGLCDHCEVECFKSQKPRIVETPPPQGWQCPVCRTVHAPVVLRCLCDAAEVDVSQWRPVMCDHLCKRVEPPPLTPAHPAPPGKEHLGCIGCGAVLGTTHAPGCPKLLVHLTFPTEA